jgi:hypothetical protein
MGGSVVNADDVLFRCDMIDMRRLVDEIETHCAETGAAVTLLPEGVIEYEAWLSAGRPQWSDPIGELLAEWRSQRVKEVAA